ncbi:MAG: DUF481 domain-containing protein [Ferruginibacter sp.]
MKQFYLINLLLTICCISANNCMGQIVNMESQRYHTDTTGWAGSVGGSFALTNYGQKVFDVDANAHVQYKSKKSLYLFLGGYGFLKGDQQSYVDYGFLHLRYNYKLTKNLRLEAFTQLQQNTITKVQSRFLIGAGPRYKIVDNQKIRMYLGSLPMYEIEKETGVRQNITDWRCSNYLSFTIIPNKQTELTTTTYYQPVMFDAGDYRLLNQSSCKVKAGKKISVVIRYNYQFDASPAAGINRETYTFGTGIDVSL